MNETDLASLAPDDPIDLLERPVFTVVDGDGRRATVSLAGLLARLGHGEETELAYLMPHQQHVMHALCVQLAALVCARSGNPDLRRTEAEWRDGLRQLAGSVEAFQLVVSDLGKPAFMQPPVPEGSIEDFKAVESPDDLDILVLAKNHDVKSARIRRPRIEHWVFALVSLQSQEGYSGSRNYGVSRMNGGYGNRPGLGASSLSGFAPRFCRDVGVLSRSRPDLLTDNHAFRDGGLALVWTLPWDGATSIAVSDLDPFYLEVCRRIRFVRTHAGTLHVLARSTAVRRIDAEDLLGNTGDAWTPIRLADGAALTVAGRGFTYHHLHELLFGEEWRKPNALLPAPGDGDKLIVSASALARGQGDTDGFHSRTVVMPSAARRLFASREGRSSLGALAKQRIDAASALRLKVLKPALCAYLSGGKDDLKLDDKRPNDWLDAVEAEIDAEFFPRLFADVDADADVRAIEFEKWLIDLGRKTLERAMRALPTPSARRERAVAAAEGRFVGGARKNFPRVFPARTTPEHTAAQEDP